jgi:glycerol-3-phosphate dehydrogenase (NAD(P)+)
MKITVLGAGNMGTTIAQIIASNGYEVDLWNYEGDAEPLVQIKTFQENRKYLPGIILSKKIHVQTDLETAVKKSSVIFFVVPSNFFISISERVGPFLTSAPVIVDVSKGLRESDWDFSSKKKLGKIFKNIVVLSGPAIAADLARGGFTAMNIASKNKRSIEMVKKVLENNHLVLLPTTDIRGTKICGALKNMYAILMGICDGLEIPMNTKAFLLTQALEEMGNLIEKMGGKKKTIYSLAGLGDLIGTSLCATSRNRRFGEFLVYAETVKAAEEKVGQVVEGIRAAEIVHLLAKRYGLAMPIAEIVYRLVWKKASVQKELKQFLMHLHDKKKK